MKTERREYLERLARSVGWNPEITDRDTDLVSICRERGLDWVD